MSERKILPDVIGVRKSYVRLERSMDLMMRFQQYYVGQNTNVFEVKKISILEKNVSPTQILRDL